MLPNQCNRWSGPWTWKIILNHLALMSLFFAVFRLLYKYQEPNWDEYGNVAYVLLIFRLLPLLSLPFCLFNFIGLYTFPLQLPQINCESSVKGFAAPFLSFRVVTRGLYPELVAKNVERNLETCYKIGLEHFQFEVVTDRPIHLPAQRHVREIVVPEDYHAPNGCKFKARALQYCLEPHVNILSDEDWIIHLDEETIVTPDSVKGVFNFAAKGEFHFGQGVITYTNLGIENPILTLADSLRVANDYGLIRFQFSKLNIPFFSMKGSFVVANAGAEGQITWDHGPEGSIAEDAFFAIIAMSKGFKFGFIPAEMWESSPFTFGDYLKQRQRWLLGLKLLVMSNNIPWFAKPGVTMTVLAWCCMPLTTLGVIISHFYPLSIPWLDLIIPFITTNYAVMGFLGTALSFSPRRVGWSKFIGYLLLTTFGYIIAFLGENLASLTSWVKGDFNFHIVQKEKDKHQSTAPSSTDLREEQLILV